MNTWTTTRIPYQKLSFSPETSKGAASVAGALGYQPEQMVKTLIFESGAGECVLVMLGGDKNAVSGHLKRAIGDRNIRLAAPETVYNVTGYQIGSIPPISLATLRFPELRRRSADARRRAGSRRRSLGGRDHDYPGPAREGQRSHGGQPIAQVSGNPHVLTRQRRPESNSRYLRIYAPHTLRPYPTLQSEIQEADYGTNSIGTWQLPQSPT